MFARLCFAGALLASGPSFAEPTNLRMAQADNCPGLQHCTMMHALCQAACERSLPDNPDAPSAGVCSYAWTIVKTTITSAPKKKWRGANN